MSIPVRELPRVAWRKILREVRSRTAPRKPRAIKVGATDKEIAADIRERQTPRFFGIFPEQAAFLGQFFPDAMWLTIAEAEKLCEHHFDILGSGDTYFGTQIPWHSDFIRGHTWPLKHHTRLTLTSPNGGYDVKVPWELSRFHHVLRLGQAYLYTLDEKYAQEIITQITDWIEKNPYEFGVNWAGPMDVAIRAINWIWAYYCIIESEALTRDFLAKWLASLRQHGDYLVKHLEDGWPRTNHLIANLAGLAYLGIMFPEFEDSTRWQSIGINRLWRELAHQVNPDGMSYEASIPYHRLVTEITLSVAALCVTNNIPIPETTQARLGSMLDAIMAYTRPDGTAPQIGDADDGRLLPLTVHADRRQTSVDHRHLLALGSLVLERELNDWAGFVDPRERGWSVAAGPEWQDAFWYFASDTAARRMDVVTRTTPRPEGLASNDWVDIQEGVRVRVRTLASHPISVEDVVGSQGHEASGLYIMRQGMLHLVVDAGGVGTDGAGGHAHNDTLSFTLHAHGRTFLIDPGSYIYTSNPAQRNAFRSTAYHNTLQIAEHEINPLPDDALFRLPEEALVTLHHWVSKETFDLLDISHNGYARLDPSVIHRRQLWFDKTAGLWLLHDALRLAHPLASSEEEKDMANSPEQIADVTLRFHIAPLPVRLDEEHNAVRTDIESGPNLVLLPLGDFPLSASIEQGWYAPRYGIKEQAPVAIFAGHVTLPADFVILFYPATDRVNFRAVRAAGRNTLLTMRDTLFPRLGRGRSTE